MILGSIISSVIDKGGDYINNREITRRTEIQGKIKKDIIQEEGKVKIETIKEEGKVAIRKQELDNERAACNEDHIRKMKEMEYDYKIKDKIEDHSYELNVMKQRDARAKQDEELKIKSEDHHQKNIRELKQLEGEMTIIIMSKKWKQ